MRVWEPNRDGADLTKHGVSGFGRGAEACTHDFPRCALLGHTRHRRRVFAPSDFISYASRKSLAPERACNGALSAMSDSSDLKRLVVRGYDKIDEYLVRYGSSSVRDRWLAELTTLVSEQACARVLDLGCGAGIPVARHLTALGHYVSGVHGSARQIALARGHDRLRHRPQPGPRIAVTQGITPRWRAAARVASARVREKNGHFDAYRKPEQHPRTTSFMRIARRRRGSSRAPF